jgi:hypothetical protein
MPRGRRNRDIDLNLDSLLDTMFNVVGILVLVVVLTQLNAGQAVNRLADRLSELPDVTPKALREARQRADELEAQIDRLSRNLDVDAAELEDRRVTLKELQAQIDRLKDMAALDPALTQKNERITQQRNELTQQKEKLQTQVNEASQTLQNLKARLADTPKRQQKPDKVVRLPRPRSAPDGWKPLFVLIVDNRLYPYRRERTQQRLQQIVKRLPKRSENEKRTAGLDRNAFTQGFRNRTSNHQYFELKASIVGKYKRQPRFTFIPRQNSGITAEQITTEWEALMRKMRPNRRYVRFLVKPGSFETYLAAREIADQHNVPAGWEIRPPQWQYHFTMGGEPYRLTQSKARIAEIDKRLARQEKNQRDKPKQDGPDIPPPKVERDVDGPID